MTQGRILFLFILSLLLVALFPLPGIARSSCQSLLHLNLSDTTITMAESVPAGPFPIAPHPITLPAFCRVAGVIKPVPGSNIKFQVWMPRARVWNGKFEGVDNGGFAGSINKGGLATALRAGFAAASTNTGHSGGWTSATWAEGHPAEVIDYGYRAIHLMTIEAKAIVQHFYGVPARWSFFAGCSNGGRQALMEAQRFPRDYNGIIAGAPANFMTHLVVGAVWDSQAILDNSASYIPASKLPAVHSAVLAACNGEDGVKDGILTDPTRCHFNPEKLLCRGVDSDSCLTAPQITALRKIYAGPSNAKGQKIFPGFMPGGELGPNGWALWITGFAPRISGQFILGKQFFSNMVFDNRAWNYRTFNFEADVQLTDKKLAHILNATNPNLQSFRSHGGKLILYHGWSDSAVPPLSTVNYYKSVVATMGRAATESFLRLYMIPGMQHCGGGAGPTSFGALPSLKMQPSRSMFSSLERWVEHDVAAGKITATRYVNPTDPASGVAMTLPLCAYPKVVMYKGNGNIHKATSFFCTLDQ